MTKSEAYDLSESVFTVGLDFDGTLVDRGSWPDYGEDLDSGYYLRHLAKLGAKFILFTMRDGEQLEDAVQFCNENLRISLLGINENPTQKAWTSSPKPHCTVFVDDRGLGIPLESWKTPTLVVDWEVTGPWLIDTFHNWKGKRERNEPV